MLRYEKFPLIDLLVNVKVFRAQTLRETIMWFSARPHIPDLLQREGGREREGRLARGGRRGGMLKKRGSGRIERKEAERERRDRKDEREGVEEKDEKKNTR